MKMAFYVPVNNQVSWRTILSTDVARIRKNLYFVHCAKQMFKITLQFAGRFCNKQDKVIIYFVFLQELSPMEGQFHSQLCKPSICFRSPPLRYFTTPLGIISQNKLSFLKIYHRSVSLTFFIKLQSVAR